MVLDESVAMWKQAIGLDGMIWTNGSDLKGMESEIVHLFWCGISRLISCWTSRIVSLPVISCFPIFVLKGRVDEEEIKCFYFQVRAKGGVENVDSLLFYSRSLHVNIRGVQVEKLAVGVVSSTLVCRWVRARTWGVHLFL